MKSFNEVPKQKTPAELRRAEIDRLKGQQGGDTEAGRELAKLVREEQEELRRVTRAGAAKEVSATAAKKQAEKTTQPPKEAIIEPMDLPEPAQRDLFPQHEKNDQQHL